MIVNSPNQPKNPSKYLGDPTKIVYRSLWERKCMRIFDENPNVIRWASEEMAIPYFSPVDKKRHRLDGLPTWP